MKKIIVLCLMTFFFNCKSFLYNTALQSIGAFDENVTIEKMTLDRKEVVFIPMVHLSTELFFQDVSKKVDSLKKEGFVFYYEHIKANIKEDTLLRKIRKIRGVPHLKKGYKGALDSVLGNIKLKKKLINQPPYEALGLNLAHSRNVDASLEEVIDFYELKYGKIILNPCDFTTSIYEKTTCDDKKIEDEILDDIIVNFRNSIVVNEVLNDENNKIVILYGRAHFNGIKEELLKHKFLITIK